jgi:omega-6 fatty acid desaturase (delta-12 desaturase)
MEQQKPMRTGPELIRATKPFAQEDRRRSWWHFGSTLAASVGLLGATCLDLPWLLRLPFSVLAGLVLIRLFVLYHDYLHGAILRGSRLADVVFRTCGLLMLAPPSIWKQSHDHHHHHNAQIFAENMGAIWLMTTDEYAKANRWQRLGYAVVRNPLIILLGYFTIFLFSMCLQPLFTKPRRHLDAAAALLLQAGLIAGLAVFAPVSLVFTFLIPVMLADALGSYLFYAQHNFPGARFPNRANWDYVAAALHSSSYLRMNPVMAWFTGNIGYHHVHHLNARIPLYRLPEAMAGIEELQSPGTTSLHPRDVYRCLQLKLWDPKKNSLVSFRECREALTRGDTSAAAARPRKCALSRKLVMAVNCDVVLQWSATPSELTALGAALWRWCNRTAGAAGVYQYLNHQALADLMAGKLPAASGSGRRGVHFWIRDEESLDRLATIGSLRREIPVRGVEDIVVDGVSWSVLAATS